MNRLNNPTLLFGLTAIAISIALPTVYSSAAAQMCKWVDENGTVHYAERCPEEVQAPAEVPIDQPPPGATTTPGESAYQGLDPDRNARSLTLDRLGPLPQNTSSRYLETLATGVSWEAEGNLGNFTISFKPSRWLPAGALIEVRFPDTANPGQAMYEEQVYDGSAERLFFMSRESQGFKCWTYHVTASIYRDNGKSELLGTHEQLIRSSYDASLPGDFFDVTENLVSGGHCPGVQSQVPSPQSFENMSTRQLDKECERQREAYLKPEREALIRRCMQVEKKDTEYCKRFYKDYGGAVRTGTWMSPPKYSDLPVCVAAREAQGHKK